MSEHKKGCVFVYIRCLCVGIRGRDRKGDCVGVKKEGCKMLTGIRITVVAKYSWASFCVCIFVLGWNDAHIRPHCCSYAERVRDTSESFSPLASTWLIDTLPVKISYSDCFVCRFYPPYSITNRMIAQPPMSPYISPVSTYPASICSVRRNSRELIAFPHLCIFLEMKVEFELMVDMMD